MEGREATRKPLTWRERRSDISGGSLHGVVIMAAAPFSPAAQGAHLPKSPPELKSLRLERRPKNKSRVAQGFKGLRYVAHVTLGRLPGSRVGVSIGSGERAADAMLRYWIGLCVALALHWPARAIVYDIDLGDVYGTVDSDGGGSLTQTNTFWEENYGDAQPAMYGGDVQTYGTGGQSSLSVYTYQSNGQGYVEVSGETFVLYAIGDPVDGCNIVVLDDMPLTLGCLGEADLEFSFPYPQGGVAFGMTGNDYPLLGTATPEAQPGGGGTSIPEPGALPLLCFALLVVGSVRYVLRAHRGGSITMTSPLPSNR
jgi:hypothetical protein